MSEQLEKSNINIKIVGSIIIGVALFVAWFYNQVIIPIQQVQITVVQIQSALSEQATNYKTLDTRLNVVENKLNIPLQ